MTREELLAFILSTEWRAASWAVRFDYRQGCGVLFLTAYDENWIKGRAEIGPIVAAWGQNKLEFSGRFEDIIDIVLEANPTLFDMLHADAMDWQNTTYSAKPAQEILAALDPLRILVRSVK